VGRLHPTEAVIDIKKPRVVPDRVGHQPSGADEGENAVQDESVGAFEPQKGKDRHRGRTEGSKRDYSAALNREKLD
jgi:hypothetical protein